MVNWFLCYEVITCTLLKRKQKVSPVPHMWLRLNAVSNLSEKENNFYRVMFCSSMDVMTSNAIKRHAALMQLICEYPDLNVTMLYHCVAMAKRKSFAWNNCYDTCIIAAWMSGISMEDSVSQQWKQSQLANFFFPFFQASQFTHKLSQKCESNWKYLFIGLYPLILVLTTIACLLSSALLGSWKKLITFTTLDKPTSKVAL